MSAYEVTQELYEDVMTGNPDNINKNPSTFKSASFEEIPKYLPVEMVTWYEIIYFCNRLSEKTGLEKVYTIKITNKDNGTLTDTDRIISAEVEIDITKNGYRLPTEAEWELAARGGDPFAEEWNYEFSGRSYEDGVIYKARKNSELDLIAWWGDSSSSPHQVGLKEPNSLGLYDMSGNVWEWCWDLFEKDVTKYDYLYIIDGIVTNPLGPSRDENSIMSYYPTGKGGGYNSNSSEACIVTTRAHSSQSYLKTTGFRIARTVKL